MTASTIPSAMAIGKGDRRWKNEFKMYTVKCQVHKFGVGNAVLGYVVGNEAKPEDGSWKCSEEALSYTKTVYS